MRHHVFGIAAALLLASVGGVPVHALDACRPASDAARENIKDDCPNCIFRSLVITDEKVVGSARTAPAQAEWQFGHLVRQMAGAVPPGQFVLNWFKSFEAEQTINGFKVPARTGLRAPVIEAWKKAQGIAPGVGTDAAWAANIDFSKAPFQLTSILYRPDLARFEQNNGQFTKVLNGGEGRFVFQLLDEQGNPLAFTIIFEYELVAESGEALQAWARDWKGLATSGSDADYNARLVAITKRFTNQNPVLGKGNPHLDRINNVSLNQIRTNDFVGQALWELREFRLAPDGTLKPSTVKMTPDLSFNSDRAKQTVLRKFIADNARGSAPKPPAVTDGAGFLIPWQEAGQSFLAGSAIVPVDFVTQDQTWLRGDTQVKREDRLWFSFNTCNGCHGADGKKTPFTHIDARGSRGIGSVSTLLSDFLCDSDLLIRKGFLLRFSEIAGSQLLTELNRPALTPFSLGRAPAVAPQFDLRQFVIERQTRVH